MVAGLVLSVELGLLPLYEHLAGLRVQLYHKLKLSEDKMQTYLPILQGAHLFTPNRTWCLENELWLKHYHVPPKSTKSSWDRNWWWGKSRIYKYAPIASMDGDSHVKDGFSRSILLG